MTNSKSLRRHYLSAHLSQEQIFNFLADNVTPAEKRKMELHLQKCTLCTEALEGFSQADAATTQATVLELNHLIRKRTARRKKSTLLSDIKTWGFATAIIFLLLISAAIVWNTVQHSPTPPTAPPATVSPSRITTSYAKPIKGYEHLKTYLVRQQVGHQDLPQGKARRKGKVILTFIVNPDSTLSSFSIIRSLGSAYDQAAISLVKNGPAWQPARDQGRVVAQKVTLTIPFK